MIDKLLPFVAGRRDNIVARGREVIGIEVEAMIQLEQGLVDAFAMGLAPAAPAGNLVA